MQTMILRYVDSKGNRRQKSYTDSAKLERWMRVNDVAFIIGYFPR